MFFDDSLKTSVFSATQRKNKYVLYQVLFICGAPQYPWDGG